MEYSIRKITKSNINELSLLIDKTFNLKTNHKKKLVDWKFFEPNNKYLYAYGAYDGKNLVSFYSDKVMLTTNGKKKYKSTICLDMCTHPDYRRKGLITLLSKSVYKKIKEGDFDFSFGFSNENGVKVDKYSKNYGYSVIGQFKTLRKLLIPKFNKSRLKVDELSDLQELRKLVVKNYLQILPNQEYLNWRFKDNSFLKKCRYLKISNGTSDIGYAIVEHKKRGVGILKIIASTSKDYKNIINAISTYYSRKGKIYISITILPNNFWKNLLEKAKFLPFVKNEKYFFTVYPHKKINKVNSPENWILMGGDIL